MTSSQTRSDISFGACEISVSVADAKISDPAIANKGNEENIKRHSMLCFSGAAFVNLRNALSQGGFIIFLINKNNKHAAIS